MSIRVAPLSVSDAERSTLEGWVRSSTVKSGLSRRARIVLLASEQRSNTEIAELVGVSRPTVLQWRGRFQASGLAALEDLDRPGRPRVISHNEIVVATLTKPPAKLGVTHWSSRLLATELGVSFATVAKVWRDWNLQPWRVETFKFSTDPELDAKVKDVVGLYMNPPENAIVVCVDEKTQIQALDRTAPILPLRAGIPEKQTHDYKRNGTTSLFAALEVATGKVTDGCYDRHTNAEFLHFLKLVAKAHPRRQLHIVCDNYATHKHPNIAAWLQKNPRITLHFTPTSGSWLNMVEIFFGIITRQAIRRGTFQSVPDLKAAIRTFIDGWNQRCEPFVWTKDAETILAKAKRQSTSNTRH
jgi:transposase